MSSRDEPSTSDLQAVLSAISERLPPGELRERFLAMKMVELAEFDPESPVWRQIFDAIPANTRVELSRRLVVATKPTHH